MSVCFLPGTVELYKAHGLYTLVVCYVVGFAICCCSVVLALHCLPQVVHHNKVWIWHLQEAIGFTDGQVACVSMIYSICRYQHGRGLHGVATAVCSWLCLVIAAEVAAGRQEHFCWLYDACVCVCVVVLRFLMLLMLVLL